ncbi:MAG: hypothetical protein HKM95_12830 [Inquilinus sp.]|nr:hypothetical protein [Inquilinus sp.]
MAALWGIARVLPWRLIGIAAAVGFSAWHYLALRADRDAAEDLARAQATEIAALRQAMEFQQRAADSAARTAEAATRAAARFDTIRRQLDAPSLDAPIPADLDAVLRRLRDARTGGAVPDAADPGGAAQRPDGA